jgi:nucleotide-binding universal stress UspA family protein
MYRTLLVPVDGSPAASAGLAEAIRIAAQTGARLHLMNIVDDMAFASAAGASDESAAAADDLRTVVRERGEQVLRLAQADAEAQGVIASTALVRSGDERLVALVARQAEECGADLVVLGTHGGRGLSRLLMTNPSEHLLNIVAVPVMLVRSEDVGPGLSVVELTASESMFPHGSDGPD